MSAARKLRDLFRLRILQMATLGSLLAWVIWRSLALKLSVRDLDNWWHLKVGEWIVHNRAFPHTGIFSATAANHPWAAYSWGYEVLLALSYKCFDIVGMGVFGTVLTVLVAVSVYRMTRRRSGRFWVGCLTATVACSVFLFTMCPRPVYFTMMLFATELTLILEANRSGRCQPLYWLPLVFFFWANLHIQFIYGLAIVGLLVSVTLVQRLAAARGWSPEFLLPAILPAGPVAAVFAVCILATFINPYSYHLYGIVYGYAGSKVPYQMIQELQPLTFQVPSHYLQVLLTGAGFVALVRKRKVDLFKTGMLIVATVIGYRTMRDSWFICIAAAACIADVPAEEGAQDRAETWFECLGLAAFLVVAGLLSARNTDFNRSGLDATISSAFPVDAVNYLRNHPQPGPLYNTLDWGGFLIWYMPDYPVAIDGRGDLYGDEMVGRFFDTGGAGVSYLTDPYLNEAGLVLLERDIPLAALLRGDQRFQKIYEDRLAVVFVRR
jgi:hypothetical protein